MNTRILSILSLHEQENFEAGSMRGQRVRLCTDVKKNRKINQFVLFLSLFFFSLQLFLKKKGSHRLRFNICLLDSSAQEP